MSGYPEFSRVLLMQLRRIGDVLLSTPVIRALKADRPDLYLAFLTEAESRSILQTNPYLDQLIVWDKTKYHDPLYVARKLRELRERKFNTAIDLQGSARTALAAFLSGAKNRLGFDYPARSMFYNLKVKRDATPKYGAAFKLDIIRPLGITTTNCRPEIHLTPPARAWRERFFDKFEIIDDFRPKVAVSVISRRPYKRWPLERYAELCTWLVDRFNTKAILVWGPGEKSIAEKVAGMAGDGIVISDETPTLLELAALLEGCDLLVGNDNGVKHLAVSVGTPTFTIYGPSDPVSWTYPDPHNHRFVKAECSCVIQRLDKNKCRGPKCLDSVTAPEVKQLLLPFLEEIISRQLSAKVAKT